MIDPSAQGGFCAFYQNPDITGHLFLRPSIWLGESCARIFSPLPNDGKCKEVLIRLILPILIALAFLPSVLLIPFGLVVKGCAYSCSLSVSVDSPQAKRSQIHHHDPEALKQRISDLKKKRQTPDEKPPTPAASSSSSSSSNTHVFDEDESTEILSSSSSSIEESQFANDLRVLKEVRVTISIEKFTPKGFLNAERQEKEFLKRQKAQFCIVLKENIAGIDSIQCAEDVKVISDYYKDEIDRFNATIIAPFNARVRNQFNIDLLENECAEGQKEIFLRAMANIYVEDAKACRKSEKLNAIFNAMVEACQEYPEEEAWIALYDAMFPEYDEELREEFQTYLNDKDTFPLFLDLLVARCRGNPDFSADVVCDYTAKFPHHIKMHLVQMGDLSALYPSELIVDELRTKDASEMLKQLKVAMDFIDKINFAVTKINEQTNANILLINTEDLLHKIYYLLIPTNLFDGRQEEDKEACLTEFLKAYEAGDQNFAGLLHAIIHTDTTVVHVVAIFQQLVFMNTHLPKIDVVRDYQNHLTLATRTYAKLCNKQSEGSLDMNRTEDSRFCQQLNQQSEAVAGKLNTVPILPKFDTSRDAALAALLQDQINS